MSKAKVPPGIQGLLVQRLSEIPDGQIEATAQRAGLDSNVLRRLRRGEQANVKLDTLEKIARGLQVPPSAVIAGPGDKAYLPTPPTNHTAQREARIRRVLQKLLDGYDDLARIARELPDA